MEHNRILRRERRLLAALLGVTPRTLQLWADERRAIAYAPPGRPRIPRAERRRARQRVADEMRRQGKSAGWRPIHEALGDSVSVSLVQESLGKLKRALARRHRRAAIRRRLSVHVHARDVLWAQDATQVGRIEGEAVLAEVVRDVATTRTAGMQVGAPACARDVIALLKKVAEQRGGLPLVHSLDNGGPYKSEELAEWSEEHQVILLHNVPHVPQHNACVERGHGELKAESGLASHLPLRDLSEAQARLDEAAALLDGARPRASRGGYTAEHLDARLRRGDDLVPREVFYAAARENLSRAVQNATTPRARRLAEREAIFVTMESFGLSHRTRGGVPLHAIKSESVL